MRFATLGGITLAVLAACDRPVPAEGTQPGDCDDGADNDGNGYFDCQDRGCWGSPVCKDDGGGGGDTNGGANGDTNGGANGEDPPDVSDDAIAAKYKAFAARYTFSLAFTGGNSAVVCQTYFGSPTKCDCTTEFEATGVLVEAAGNRNTYQGTFVATSSDCFTVPVIAGPPFGGKQFDSFFVWRPDDGKSFHSFMFDYELETVDEWIAHYRKHMYEVTETPNTDRQAAEQYMFAPFDEAAGAFTYASEQQILIGLIAFDLASALRVQFSETTTVPAFPE